VTVTIRLVGLMSLVLLVSLAAFALLMNSYQVGVMNEVTRTVSNAGKATLKTFIFHADGDPAATTAIVDAAPPAGTHSFQIRTKDDVPSGDRDGTKVVIVRVKEIASLPDSSPPGGLSAPPHASVRSASPLIPKMHAYQREEQREIVLPVPTRAYQDLFAAFRRRTLLLFVAIFVVGTALSAGLAARFTRPVRKLDAGIRRLTQGDLGAEVEDSGSDEIGRLARGFNEMTRRLRASREREREMRRREKLSALGRLAAGVAHDVRNPLHAIGLTLQNLEETARPGEPAPAAEFDRSLAIIREEIRRLDRLVENFLRFARSDRRVLAPVDLGRVARETARLVENEAQRRAIRLEVAVEGDPGTLEGDEESIRSSVLNLVLNSFEAMPGGGTVTLSVRGAGSEAWLEVVDDGRGIPEADQEKIFEFAYTTKEEGHGLGLAMVHQVVVEDHGGRVTLRSRKGEGTSVLLAFPLPRAPLAETSS
jgi:signal transduction histidine kinase